MAKRARFCIATVKAAGESLPQNGLNVFLEKKVSIALERPYFFNFWNQHNR